VFTVRTYEPADEVGLERSRALSFLVSGFSAAAHDDVLYEKQL
jgi:hypothetical protein